MGSVYFQGVAVCILPGRYLFDRSASADRAEVVVPNVAPGLFADALDIGDQLPDGAVRQHGAEGGHAGGAALGNDRDRCWPGEER